MSMDGGTVKIRGMLQVYKNNFYTSIAPIWVTLDGKTKDYLRGRGGQATLALFVPSPDYQKEENEEAVSIGVNEDPAYVAQKYGTMVALLKLKRVR